MRKLKILFSIFLFLLCFFISESYAQCACSAKFKDITPSIEFEYADVIFVGKVIEIKKSERDKQTGSYTETVKFEIKRVWKTDLPKFVTVVNKIQGCINGFEVEKEWLIYAYKRSDGTFGNGCCCSRTTILQRAGEYLNEFEKNGEKEMKILEEPSQEKPTKN